MEPDPIPPEVKELFDYLMAYAHRFAVSGADPLDPRCG